MAIKALSAHLISLIRCNKLTSHTIHNQAKLCSLHKCLTDNQFTNLSSRCQTNTNKCLNLDNIRLISLNPDKCQLSLIMGNPYHKEHIRPISQVNRFKFSW